FTAETAAYNSFKFTSGKLSGAVLETVPFFAIAKLSYLISGATLLSLQKQKKRTAITIYRGGQSQGITRRLTHKNFESLLRAYDLFAHTKSNKFVSGAESRNHHFNHEK
ncbi:MAG: hypothetical protein PHC51_10895, partial [bacterium]|nr:hypothetical protein [bacterium]